MDGFDVVVPLLYGWLFGVAAAAAYRRGCAAGERIVLENLLKTKIGFDLMIVNEKGTVEMSIRCPENVKGKKG